VDPVVPRAEILAAVQAALPAEMEAVSVVETEEGDGE